TPRGYRAHFARRTNDLCGARSSPNCRPPYAVPGAFARLAIRIAAAEPVASRRPAFSLSLRREAVEAAPIVPEELALRSFRDRQLDQARHGPREFRVPVGIVGREDHVVVAQPLDVGLHRLLVRLDRDEAVRPEVFGRLL